jgi:general secretion pathway protein G
VFERHREIQQRRKNGEGSEYGFTLIELLIVIVVLGILAAIVIFSLTGVSGQSKAAACTADAKSVEIAADAYQAKNSTYPASVATLVPTYLHSAPVVATNGYTISIDTTNHVVQVAIGTAAAVDFSDTNNAPCNTLG